MAYVYRHIRLDKNIPFYIGIGSDSKYKRADNTTSRNKFWKRITNKTQYRVEIMLDDLSWEEACEKEIELVALYGRSNLNLGPLCNLTNGGDGAHGVIFSESRKDKLSEKYSGEGNPFYGKKHSSETIDKLKQLASNRSLETLRKIADKNRNKKIPDSIKLKMSNALKGSKNPFYGKTHTDEAKRKMSDKAKNRVVSDLNKTKHRLGNRKRIELFRYVNGVFYTFNSMREAATSLNISRFTIVLRFKELGFITKQEAISMGLL